MPKPATVLMEVPRTESGLDASNMAQRQRVAMRLRARMAVPVTPIESQLWRELEEALTRDRPAFRS